MGNISVIIENANIKDTDNEDMVIVENKGSIGTNLENINNYKIDYELTQEHGHLVAQILETQRELVNTDNVDVLPKKIDIVGYSYLFSLITRFTKHFMKYRCSYEFRLGRRVQSAIMRQR